MSSERDIKHLRMAFENARDLGTDPSTQNGAVIVDSDDWILGEGANFFPKGVKETEAHWEMPLKYAFVEHAERNAIYAAAREGHSLKGPQCSAPGTPALTVLGRSSNRA
jgi:dCMP deaminase